MNKRFPIIFFLALIFITGCGKAESPPPPALSDSLPPNIGSVELTETITGEAAAEMSTRLHQRRLRNAKEMAIGSYGTDISVWLSEYATAKEARSETDRMVKAMQRIGGDFGSVRVIKLAGRTAYVVAPGGQTQYFWSRGKILVYVIAGGATEQEVEAAFP
ncbi:MAG: hypothetical protein WC891_04120 [Actinomycetota bacterium]